MILLRDIISAVAVEARLLTDDITGPCRRAEIVRARDAAAWLARSITGRSLPEIGRALGRHHTSIMHSLEKQRAHPDAETLDLIARAAARLSPRQFTVTFRQEAA